MAINYPLIRRIVITSISVAFLIGCSESTPSPDQIDKSPFTGNPCAAPCWHDLVIGRSSERDVLKKLPTLTFIDQSTVQMFRKSMPNIDFSTFAPGVEIIADCVHPNQQCLSLTVVDDILTEIVVQLNYEIRPDEAVDYLGSPDYIGYQNLGAERIICETYLVWRDKQFVLASRHEGPKAAKENCHVVRDQGKIPSSLLISEAKYMSPTAVENLISTGTGKFVEFTGTIQK